MESGESDMEMEPDKAIIMIVLFHEVACGFPETQFQDRESIMKRQGKFLLQETFFIFAQKRRLMSTAIIIDGKKTNASGSIIRQYRKIRGLTQDELGERLQIKKSRVSKIENDENLDISVLLKALKHLDVEAQVVVTAKNKSEMDEVYTFISSCVDAFAKAKCLTRKSAFNYLNLFKGINFLISCYDVEITLPLEEILNDMTLVCQRNGGTIK